MPTITSLWVVTKPKRYSTLQDICFRATLAHDLCKQYRGGLDPDDIVGFYTNQSDAEDKARRLLRQARMDHHADRQ